LVLLAAVLLPAWNAAPAPASRPTALAQSESSAASSTESSLTLDWTAPPECPDGNAVRSDAIRLAGAATAGSRHLKARASILPATGTGWNLSLATDLDGVTGERSLSGVSCASLAEAAALMLALIMNPDLALAARPGAASPEASPQAGTIASTNDRGLRPRGGVGAHAGIQTGVIENLTSSFALSFDISLGRFSLRLMPGLSLPQSVFVDPEQKLGGRLWLGTASGLGCWPAPVGWLALSPCLGLEVTRLQGHGLGVLQPRDATAYWSSAELAFFVGLPVGHGVQFELGGIGLLALHRPTVYLEGIGPVSRPAVFGFGASGGLAWRF
jgi:hypothetical protein